MTWVHTTSVSKPALENSLLFLLFGFSKGKDQETRMEEGRGKKPQIGSVPRISATCQFCKIAVNL